ncbi:MAG: cytochrome c oxidase assembly protein [Pirellulales bacterium]
MAKKQHMTWPKHLCCAFAICAAVTSNARGHAGVEHVPNSDAVDDSGSQGLVVTGPRNWQELARAWEFDPLVVLPLLLSGYWYSLGLLRLWRSAGRGGGIRRWEAAAFGGGWLALVVALISPLHRWGGMLFSAHMTQHEVLMLVVAPLLVLGKPLIGILKGLPAGWARDLVHWTSARWWRYVWHAITNPFAAWLIHAVILWAWHIPLLFEATLSNDFAHALQHLSFLLSALLFWWAVMQGPRRALNFGIAVVYMFTTALHSGALGALITFSNTVWYPAYRETAPFWGLSALEDQQLGGLVMWIPACTLYIIAGLALVVGSMRASDERVRRWEKSPTAAASIRNVPT